ncbi:uncharacterized protein LOC105934643 [Fundulus heteroclitus]|uniref:uncharacterized protein LOC105934643 n=1 Tax=Fundulus heteroclitus TaxID=8078 RepID=UPI00165A2464|nr:uncharacterized protein LOC105934643 [Fundulus heteroclitus]
MPTTCCAPGCTQRHSKSSGVRFFRLPRDEERRRKWVVSMRKNNPNRLWTPSRHDRICSLHFISGEPSTDVDHPDFLPTIFYFSPLTKSPTTSLERFERVVKRRRRLALAPYQRKEKVQSSHPEPTPARTLLLLAHHTASYKDSGTNPDPDPLQRQYDQLKRDYAGLQQEYQRVLDENRRLKAECEASRFTYTNLDNPSIKTLTGLPTVDLFKWLMSLVCLYLKPMGKLCSGDILLLVLMKLKLGCTSKDLAIRFKVAPTQVSAILNSAIPIIAKRLEFLIRWPTRGEVLKNMPKVFRRQHGGARVIIDCGEILIQRPVNSSARATTWSNNMHHNTAKFLIGITPCGTVSFLSSSWGGRIFDKELTEQSGFYDKLEPGDLVLADKRFLIAEELAAYGASLAMPPFASSHVERAIERVKQFGILKNVMPLTLSRHIDSILIICCAITNVLPKLLK